MVGNAVGLLIEPMPDADLVRVLRKMTDDISGPGDVGALKIFEDEPTDSLLDLTAVNGQAYFYKDFSRVDGVWEDDGAESVAATANATYQESGPDLRRILIDRYRAGFAQEILRGLLKLKPQPGAASAEVPVQSAPPAFKNTKWPVASVHLQADMASERAIGDSLSADVDTEDQGWIAQQVFNITAWSQNPDERAALHKSLRRIFMANLPVFASYGLLLPELRVEDVDFIEGQYDAEVYCAVATITFRAPISVNAPVTGEVVDEIDVEPQVYTRIANVVITDSGDH